MSGPLNGGESAVNAEGVASAMGEEGDVDVFVECKGLLCHSGPLNLGSHVDHGNEYETKNQLHLDLQLHQLQQALYQT